MDALGLETVSPPEDAERAEGMFNLVVDDSNAKVRHLPTFYVRFFQFFAHREVDAVLERLRRLLQEVPAREDGAPYLLQPCRLGDRIGLYARDYFNRSRKRRELARLGMEFADEQWVVLTRDGRFRCESWGEFTPSFVILGVSSADLEKVTTRPPAEVILTLAQQRLHNLSVEELKLLTSVATEAQAWTGGEASELIRVIGG